MIMDERGLVLKDEAFRIVGAAMEVSNHLGCGFLEAVYQEALGLEFTERRIPHCQQAPIEIAYKGISLRKGYIADFLCFGKIIVEIKAIKEITSVEEAQILNYLKATQMPLGIVINFGSPQLQFKRYAYTRDTSKLAANVR